MIIDLIKKGKTKFVGKLKNLFSKKKQEEPASEHSSAPPMSYSIPVTTASGLTNYSVIVNNGKCNVNVSNAATCVSDFMYYDNDNDFHKDIGLISISCKEDLHCDDNLKLRVKRRLDVCVQCLNRRQNPFLTCSSVIPDLYDETKPLSFTLSESYYDDNISKSSEHMMVKLGYALEQVKQLEHDITEAIDFFADTMVGNGELAEACEEADDMERLQNQLKEETEQ